MTILIRDRIKNSFPKIFHHLWKTVSQKLSRCCWHKPWSSKRKSLLFVARFLLLIQTMLKELPVVASVPRGSVLLIENDNGQYIPFRTFSVSQTPRLYEGEQVLLVHVAFVWGAFQAWIFVEVSVMCLIHMYMINTECKIFRFFYLPKNFTPKCDGAISDNDDDVGLVPCSAICLTLMQDLSIMGRFYTFNYCWLLGSYFFNKIILLLLMK